MRPQRTVQTTLVALLGALCLAATPASALSGTASAFISWSVQGNANPGLIYTFQSSHSTTFTQFNALEAFEPVTHVGQLMRGGSQWRSCTDLGVVNHVIFSCTTSTAIVGCPTAEGIWRGITRTTAFAPPLGQIFTAATGPVYANCPVIETPCLLGIPSDVNQVVSLDTGLPVDHAALGALPSVRLKRKATDSHGEFMLDEWAIVSPAENGQVRVSKSSSDTYEQHLFGEPRPMLDALGQAGGSLSTDKAAAGRYLVIQGSGHRYKLPAPLVRWQAPTRQIKQANAGVARVAVRASFNHHGGLDGVETLDGDSALGEQLAKSLALDFVEGAEHRVALFAIFEVDSGSVELLTAFPVMPRCCCGEYFCV